MTLPCFPPRLRFGFGCLIDNTSELCRQFCLCFEPFEGLVVIWIENKHFFLWHARKRVARRDDRTKKLGMIAWVVWHSRALLFVFRVKYIKIGDLCSLRLVSVPINKGRISPCKERMMRHYVAVRKFRGCFLPPRCCGNLRVNDAFSPRRILLQLSIHALIKLVHFSLLWRWSLLVKAGVD